MHAAQDDVEVTPLELLFDIVFAFTTTQLTTLLAGGSLAAIPQVVLIFLVLFWMYGGYVWLMNQVPAGGVKQRMLLIVGMSGFLLCALAVPGVFSGDGVVFGLGYLVVILIHTSLYLNALGADARLFAPFNVVGAVTVIVAGLVTDAAAYVLWLVVLGLQLLSARFANKVTRRSDWHMHPRHFVERNSGLLLIAIGESIIATGIGIAGTRLDASVILAASVGFALSAALWWVHFDVDEPLGVTAMTSATREDMLRIALGAYFYAYTVMFLGIIATAAGVRLSIARFAETDTTEGAAFLALGVALYLVGDVMYRAACRVRPVWVRLVAAPAAAATYFIGVTFSTGVQVFALVVLIIAVLLVEGTRARTRLLPV